MLRRYGVGQIHFRQEKYEMAEYHFRRSLQVHLMLCHFELILLTRLNGKQHAGQVSTGQLKGRAFCPGKPIT